MTYNNVLFKMYEGGLVRSRVMASYTNFMLNFALFA